MAEATSIALATRLEAAGADMRAFALPGGATLFEAGENTGQVFIVRTGRLAAIERQENASPRWLGVIGPGEPIGEIAVLADRPHTATVIALRDSELFAISRNAFEAALASDPAIMVQIARLLIQRSRGEQTLSRSARAYGFLGLCRDTQARDLAAVASAAVRGLGHTVAVLGADACEQSTEWLSTVEAAHDYVFYVGEAVDRRWGSTCARQADRLFLVGRGDAPPPPLPAHAESWRGRLYKPVDLILTHASTAGAPAGAAAWRGVVSATRRINIRPALADDIARLARLLTGRSTGLVLSGGGARGYAHVGAIRALRQAGVPIDFIGGTSMGAVIGAGLAMGWEDGELEQRIRKAFVETNPLSDIAFPMLAMTRGLRVQTRLAEHFGDRDIGDLWRPFFCVSSNLTSGAHQIHDAGSLARALRASIALPGILPPVTEGDNVLVDGGVLRNLPTDLMRNINAGPIIAVDVSTDAGLAPRDLATPRPLWRWLLTGAWRRGPPIVSVLLRSATLTAARDLAMAREAADLFIAPALEKVEIRDWKAFAMAAAAGHVATLEALSGLDRPVTDLRRDRPAI